jgi:hypothetical protein
LQKHNQCTFFKYIQYYAKNIDSKNLIQFRKNADYLFKSSSKITQQKIYSLLFRLIDSNKEIFYMYLVLEFDEKLNREFISYLDDTEGIKKFLFRKLDQHNYDLHICIDVERVKGD